jgi:hypothetical protein
MYLRDWRPMTELTVFDILVRTLDSQERRSLLDRILASSEVSQTPLRADDEDEKMVDLAGEYKRMSLFRRLLILIRSLFTGQDRFAVLTQMLLRRLEGMIERHGAGLAHFRRRTFEMRMYDELAALRMSVHSLRSPLDLAMRREKEEFIAFLAGVGMPEVQKRLMEVSDPESQWRDDMELDSGSFRTELVRRCDETLEAIPREPRRAVYLDVQALNALARLALHPFGAMLACFHPSGRGEERSCGFSELARYLVALSEVLAAVKVPPTAEALRALFLYCYKDSLLDPTFRLDEHLKADLITVESALNGIREFNEAVPINLVVKYATGNLGYQPKTPGGGEDWYAVYKSFWRRRLSRNYALFYRGKMVERLAARAVAYLGVAKLPELSEYRSEQFDGESRLRHVLSLAFLKGFFQNVFARISRPLRIILTSGDFYKPENRSELNDALAYLGLIEENITSLESRLAAEGDLGVQLADARAERKSPAARLQRIRAVAEQADRNASYLVAECYKKLYNLTQVLQGILHGKSSERYDTLANLSSIGGVGNRLLVSAWSEALEQLKGALGLLREVRDVEEASLQS